jgi:hypothetical protein
MNGVGTRDKVLYGGFAIVLVIVAGLVAVAIWRDSATDEVAAPPPSVAAPTPSSEPSGEAPTKALAAYVGYWEAYVTAAANPGNPSPDLAKFVADPMLTQLRLNLRQYRDNDIVYKGRPTWTPRATDVNTTAAPYTVVIEDCFDSAGWEPVFASTGKSAAAPGQATRYVITSTVKSFQVEGWLVVESRADRSRSC